MTELLSGLPSLRLSSSRSDAVLHRCVGIDQQPQCRACVDEHQLMLNAVNINLMAFSSMWMEI